jgi:hypothetical protein
MEKTKIISSYCPSYSTEFSWLTLTHRSLDLAIFSSYTIINSRPIKPWNRRPLHEYLSWMHDRQQPANLSTQIRTSPVHNFYDNHSNKIELLYILIKICNNNNNNNIWWKVKIYKILILRSALFLDFTRRRMVVLGSLEPWRWDR